MPETTPAALTALQLPERFIPKHVEPGTQYPDEPSVNVPEGWYVLAEHEPGAGEGSDVIVKIEHATDCDGNDISELLARKIAALLDDFARGE